MQLSTRDPCEPIKLSGDQSAVTPCWRKSRESIDCRMRAAENIRNPPDLLGVRTSYDLPLPFKMQTEPVSPALSRFTALTWPFTAPLSHTMTGHNLTEVSWAVV